MKKYILILFSIISFWSCTEDESIDITVLPSVTTTGDNTFGCLMDGWIYVGGRYLNWGHSYVWTYDSFHYYPEEDKLSVNVSVKPDINIHFIILSPQEALPRERQRLRAGHRDQNAGRHPAVHPGISRKFAGVGGPGSPFTGK